MTDLLHPLRIGDVTLPNNLILSPMAGFTDLPFRVLCRRHGAGLVCSEMVAANSVNRRVEKTYARMRTNLEERPTSVQVFGTDPEDVAQATREVERHCEIIGFNMGCPAFQIKRQGCGAALLDHPELSEELVRAIKGASRKPLLVKIRVGNGSRVDVASLGKRLEAAGADGLIVHGRTAAQGYSGRSDWSVVRDLKPRLGIPVIGNGDVTDGPSAKRVLEESGVDGIALGRATLGDPHVFRRIAHYLETGEALPVPSPQARLRDFLAYVDMAQAIGMDTPHVLQQAQKFTRGIPGAGELRRHFQGRETRLEDVRAAFAAHVAQLTPDPVQGTRIGEPVSHNA